MLGLALAKRMSRQPRISLHETVIIYGRRRFRAAETLTLTSRLRKQESSRNKRPSALIRERVSNRALCFATCDIAFSTGGCHRAEILRACRALVTASR